MKVLCACDHRGCCEESPTDAEDTAYQQGISEAFDEMRHAIREFEIKVKRARGWKCCPRCNWQTAHSIPAGDRRCQNEKCSCHRSQP